MRHRTPPRQTTVEPKQLRVSLPRLVVELLVAHLLRLGLLPRQEALQPADGVATDDQARRDGRLAPRNDAVPADLLDLAAVDADDVLLSLVAHLDGEEDHLLAVLDQLARRLLDDGEAAVDGREGRVAERVRLLHVRRHVLVRLAQVGQQRVGQRVRERGREGDGARAVRVGFEGRDRVGDEGPGEEMLCGALVSLDSGFAGAGIADGVRVEEIEGVANGLREGQPTLRNAEEGELSPLT